MLEAGVRVVHSREELLNVLEKAVNIHLELMGEVFRQGANPKSVLEVIRERYVVLSKAASEHVNKGIWVWVRYRNACKVGGVGMVQLQPQNWVVAAKGSIRLKENGCVWAAEPRAPDHVW